MDLNPVGLSLRGPARGDSGSQQGPSGVPGDSVGRPLPPAGTWGVGLQGRGSLEWSSSLAVHLICPGCSMGQQQPTGHLQPLWAGEVLANTKQKTQKMPPACLQRSVPHQVCRPCSPTQLLRGTLCHSRLCLPSIISHRSVASLWEKAAQGQHILSGRGSSQGKLSCEMGHAPLLQACVAVDFMVGKKQNSPKCPGKGGSWETSGSSKLKISVQAMP